MYRILYREKRRNDRKIISLTEDWNYFDEEKKRKVKKKERKEKNKDLEKTR